MIIIIIESDGVGGDEAVAPSFSSLTTPIINLPYNVVSCNTNKVEASSLLESTVGENEYRYY